MVNDSTGKVRRRPMPDHRTLPAYVLLFFFFLPCGSFAQVLLPSSAQIVIADGTPVNLQLDQTISSAHARKEDRLDFLVTDDVTVGGFTVIRAGTIAVAPSSKFTAGAFSGWEAT
jgi:hypothetical protein